MFGLIACFILLACVFLHGASASLRNPRPTELEIEQYVRNSVYTVAQALLVGIGLLIVGLVVI